MLPEIEEFVGAKMVTPSAEKPLITRSFTTQSEALMFRPKAPAPASEPFKTTSGPPVFVFPVKAVWVAPSIVVPASEIAGREDSGLIVDTAPLKPGSVFGMLKAIVFAPGIEFASRIACRKLPAPLSLVLVTTKVVFGVHLPALPA